ncbi:MAG: type II toxin-antitoxin system VapC family toxin [Bryobacteraceae bacterium]|nr:type II toxin-antitoxin system VapC family toxin [Bryobacteraceae bacterium]
MLDTNVVSELRKGDRANAGVTEWHRQRDKRELYLSVITIAELRRGIALIRRRDEQQAAALDHWCTDLQRGFSRVGHLLTIRPAEANAWGELTAVRPLQIMDAFLAATAKTHNLSLVTRNEAHFSGLPIKVENPFAAAL